MRRQRQNRETIDMLAAKIDTKDVDLLVPL
jgi:hypothetical protein